MKNQNTEKINRLEKENGILKQLVSILKEYKEDSSREKESERIAELEDQLKNIK